MTSDDEDERERRKFRRRSQTNRVNTQRNGICWFETVAVNESNYLSAIEHSAINISRSRSRCSSLVIDLWLNTHTFALSLDNRNHSLDRWRLTVDVDERSFPPFFSSLNWFDRSTFFSSDQTPLNSMFDVETFDHSCTHLLQAMNMNNCWSIRHTDDKCLFACLVEQMDRMQLDQLLWCTAFLFRDLIDIITSSCPARLILQGLCLHFPPSTLVFLSVRARVRDFLKQSSACCF